MYLKSNTLNNATKGANWLKVWTMGQIGYLHNGLFDIIIKRGLTLIALSYHTLCH